MQRRTDVAPIDRRDHMLILGAGPVGLAVAKALGEAEIPYLHVEATGAVGGNWAHGVYETAHIISSRKTTEYPDWPMPASYPDFPSAAQMRAYLDDFADTFGLRERIWFHAEVVAASPRADALWDVALADGRALIVKGVLVCNGHHWAKTFPPWTSQFSGEILHSKDYKRPEQLAKKRVLVLGGGNSGCDLVSEAARVSVCADWSLRRGYWFLPKTFFGTPTVEFMLPWLPISAQRAMIRTLLRIVVGRYQDYGLPEPDHDIFEAHPTVSTEVFHYLKHGRVRPRPDVVGVDGQTVTFADGARAEYDLIVCATGFDLSFPFLPAELVPIEGKIAKLIGGVLSPKARHLYVVGTAQARYGIGPLLRPLALLLADWVRLQDELTVPLGQFLSDLGVGVPNSHLVDPHAAMRAMWIGRQLMPVLRARARLRGVWRGETAAAGPRATVRASSP